MKSFFEITIVTATVLAVIKTRHGKVRALEKYWLPNVEWRNPSNWLEGSTPKLDNRVIFPVEMRHVVGMPRKANFRLGGIELPADGVVALPENGKIEISEESSSKERKSSRWARETPFFWVDPLNWNGSSEAVPHMERLPCQSDLVVLPASSRTFSVRLPETRDVEIQAVRIADDNVSLARWEWRDMEENAEFLGSSFSVKYSPLMACEDCNCQEGDLSAYWEEICDVQRPRCGLQACDQPLKVEGHCCHYCGGRIRLSKKVLLSSARRIARNVLKGYVGTIFWHSRPTWDGHSEILITEKGTYKGTNTIVALADVEAALKEENMEILFSETSGKPMFDRQLAVALGPFLGGFLLLLVLVLIIFRMYGYTYSEVWEACRELGYAIRIEGRVKGGKRKSFAFARFENVSEGNVRLAEEIKTSASNAHPSITGERFENPLYRSKKGPRSGATGRGRAKALDPSEPVSLLALEKAIEHERTEEIEMNIENF